jgi:drug/metabolite transporter (DMT)-like permease
MHPVSTTTTLRRPVLSPALGILIGVAAVSTASIFVRLAQNAGAPSLAIAALRLTFASLVLLPFALSRCRNEYRALSKHDVGAAMLSGAFLGGHFATWISSLAFTSVVSSVALVSLSPLFIAIAGVLVLKEKLTRRLMIGMVIAIAGGILIGLAAIAGASPGANPALGNVLAVTAALCMAPYMIVGRALRNKLSLLAYVTLVYGAAAVTLLLLCLFTGTSLVFQDPLAYVWVALLALLPQLVGHTSFNWSVRRLPAAYATIPVLGEPVGSTMLAIVLLGETVKPLTLIGAAVALAGIAIMSWRGSKT